MPIYEEEGRITREELLDLSKRNQCKECGEALAVFIDFDSGKAFLACNDWRRSHHEGIEREASRYEKEGLASFNINTRREIMTQEIGEKKTKALDRYIDTAAITKRIATEIVETLWGDAPPIEKTKCILLCQTYQLNPLMKHIYLVGYRRKENGKFVLDGQGNPVKDWSIQVGIGATRLMAQRKHNYSYLDMTPRKATTVEIEKILGDTADPETIYGFVHIKDQDSGAEAFGLRGIGKNEDIKGTAKGNTHLNMACVRAERLALDRQYPGEMPQGVEVVDERFIEGEYRVVDGTTGEITEPKTEPKLEPPPKEHWCTEHNCAFQKKTRDTSTWYAHKMADGKWCNEKKKAEASKQEAHIPENIGDLPSDEPEPEPESQPEPEPAETRVGLIDMEWLKESLKTLQATNLKGWTESNLLSYMKTTYNVEAKTVLEAVAKLDKGQAAHFVKRVQETLDMA